MCPNGTQWSLRNHSLKDTALLATLYQSSAVINHHGPLELFPCEGQYPLLTLMAHIMVDPIQGCVMLTSWDQKGQNPFGLSLGCGADIQQPFAQD